ncbi:MAG: hypothetical protein JO345_01635 [Streptosporangiaceae bacterium]|nr:hypothetical protein [Streptosporangiaceae bacterium]
MADRPLTALTRRDVGIALLSVPAADALASLPGIRRGMLAAGNPLSQAFWTSAEKILQLIDDGEATVGDVRTWLEATGTEPNGIIGLHVWDDASERSQLAAEMHVRLVSHLEERLTSGEIDPDRLVAGDPAARRAYLEIQERWMTTELPDGRIPMNELLDEKDEELFAEWDAADAEALNSLDAVLARVGERARPAGELRAAATRLREVMSRPGWPAELLIECSGLEPKDLPADDAELWLTLAAGVASPVGSDDWDSAEAELNGDDELSETGSTIASICAIDHFDWLAVTSALATGGPGTPASAADLAEYVRDFDPDSIVGEDDEDEADRAGADDELDLDEFEDDDDYELDEEFDELGMEGLFLPVTTLWQILGAIDDDDQLTPLGWWGLPEAMRRVWAPTEEG